jgi:hypothetical protein
MNREAGVDGHFVPTLTASLWKENSRLYTYPISYYLHWAIRPQMETCFQPNPTLAKILLLHFARSFSTAALRFAVGNHS